MGLVFQFVVMTLVFAGVEAWIPGFSAVDAFTFWVVAAIVSALNLLVRPVVWEDIMPETPVVVAIITFFANLILFPIVSFLVPGFTVTGPFALITAALLAAAIHYIFEARRN